MLNACFLPKEDASCEFYSYEPKAAITGVIHDSVPYKSSPMERAQEVQANLLPELPSFAKPMLPSHVAGGFWLVKTRISKNV